jgi:hypothetical protein
VVMVLLVIGGLSSMCGGAGSSSAGDEYGAADACRTWVKDQLKAPSTANFEDESVSGTGPWTIIGTVDAENSFGANLRQRWTCSVRTERDKYKGTVTLAPW